jgi:hypothetical protein
MNDYILSQIQNGNEIPLSFDVFSNYTATDGAKSVVMKSQVVKTVKLTILADGNK